MNNVEQILGMYIKGYISKERFEQWVYDNLDLLERDFSSIYLELISTNYRNKCEVIELTECIKEYLLKRKNIVLSDINDCTVQKAVEESKEIGELVKQQELKNCIEVNCKDIQSNHDLHKTLKDIFELGEYYGMNWDAFEDYLYGDISIPQKLIFHNWNYLKEKLPKDAQILSDLLRKYILSKCEIIFKEYE